MSGEPSIRELAGRPDLLTLHRARPDTYPFLLESAARGTPQGRYDILFRTVAQSLILHADGRLTGEGKASAEGDFLRGLDAWWSRLRRDTVATDLPFHGGWFLFLGYELAGQVEPTLRLPAAEDFPVAFAVRATAAIVADRDAGLVWLVSEERDGELADMEADLRTCGKPEGGEGASFDGPLLEGALEEEPPERYMTAVEQAQRYIIDGDIFQANLSRGWSGRLSDGAGPADLYARLRESNPGPFAGLACWAGQAVVSSSPERLLRIRQGVAETRPIAGTRPRGSGGAEDDALLAELIAHPKERAEHIMLIDLERNDLGRIACPGTVSVDELMVLESYAHVHHIVSNIRAEVRDEITPGDAIRALFPGGTITGCPKVRCMEIIAELEGRARGPYTGSMGYLNRDGSLDLNILIRSVHLAGREVRFRAGGGIVADSRPEPELEETRAKARGLRLALEGEP